MLALFEHIEPQFQQPRRNRHIPCDPLRKVVYDHRCKGKTKQLEFEEKEHQDRDQLDTREQEEIAQLELMEQIILYRMVKSNQGTAVSLG